MQSTINSALCFFDTSPQQTDIISSRIVDYFPSTNIVGNDIPIQFDVTANADDYIDCQSIDLELCVQIKKTDGTNIDSKDKVGLINLPIASLFSDVTLSLNNKQIEGGDSSYPYGAYLYTLTQFQNQAKQTHLQAAGWFTDQSGKFDDFANNGLKKRVELTADSAELHLKGPVYLDFFRQSRYLLSQVQMRLTFVRAKSKFALMSFGPAASYDVHITEAVLNVRRVKMNPTVINQHAVGLKNHNAIYPVNHSVLTTFTIPATTSSFDYPNLFPIALPKAVYIAFVENESFCGNFQKNPFHFQHFGITKLGLFADGNSVACKAYQPNFKENNFVREYCSTFMALDMFNTDDSNGITMDMYKNGYFYILYNLKADCDITGENVDVTKAGNLRLELTFADPLKVPVTGLLYAIYDSSIEITRLRDVLANYQR